MYHYIILYHIVLYHTDLGAGGPLTSRPAYESQRLSLYIDYVLPRSFSRKRWCRVLLDLLRTCQVLGQPRRGSILQNHYNMYLLYILGPNTYRIAIQYILDINFRDFSNSASLRAKPVITIYYTEARVMYASMLPCQGVLAFVYNTRFTINVPVQ